MASPKDADILILGAGWTSTFLIPLLNSRSISFAATTTTGHDNTIPFKFSPESDDLAPYETLPSARTILITFPLKGYNQSKHILSLYRTVHGNSNKWIQLGSTGIFTAPGWSDHKSIYKTDDPRAIAEDELLGLGGCVLDLAGLYGGSREPRNWISRVAKSKEQVKTKSSLHMIHGDDVARAIVAVHDKFTKGERWLLTDLRVYDWWDLIQDWGAEAQEQAKTTMGAEEAAKLEYTKWIGELLIEEDVKALPRSTDSLGRALDSRAFWDKMGVWPSRGRVK